jgi:uncharacterized protein YbjT (DUF2867 family)
MPVADIAEPFIDVDDIADVATAALLDDRHIGQLYEVTGPRLLTFTEVLEVLGKPAAYVQVTPAEMIAGLVAEGLPTGEASELVDLFTTILDGRNCSLADGVQRALGRAPRDLSAMAGVA